MKLIFPIIFIVLGSTSLLAQPGPDWYTNNDRGNRYEGSYSRKVSNPSLNLVSLTATPVQYAFGNKQQLNLRFFLEGSTEYDLHAEELRITQYYWMQDKNKNAQSGWNSFEGWHVDYILKQLSIDHRNLGILVQVGDKGSRKYAPVWVSTDGNQPELKRYIAQLRMGRSAAKGSFRIYKGENRTPANLLQERAITAKSSGTIFPIIVPTKTLGDEAGWITVEINMQEKNTMDPFTYSFSFYHKP